MTRRINEPVAPFSEANGLPLEAGKVYIGEPYKNPETNPVDIFWDINLQKPAENPITTIGGFPSRGGKAANVYTSGAYSITTRDKNGRLIQSELFRGSLFEDGPNSVATFQTTMTVYAPDFAGIHTNIIHTFTAERDYILAAQSALTTGTIDAAATAAFDVNLVHKGTTLITYSYDAPQAPDDGLTASIVGAVETRNVFKGDKVQLIAPAQIDLTARGFFFSYQLLRALS